MACLILFLTSSFCNMISVGDAQKSSKASPFCSFLSDSAVRVHVSQAYGKIEMTKECISLILELSALFLSFHMVFVHCQQNSQTLFQDIHLYWAEYHRVSVLLQRALLNLKQ